MIKFVENPTRMDRMDWIQHREANPEWRVLPGLDRKARWADDHSFKNLIHPGPKIEFPGTGFPELDRLGPLLRWLFFTVGDRRL